MSQTVTVVVHQSPEHSAGLRGFTETISITFEEGGWDIDSDMVDSIVKFCGELLDGKAVTFEQYKREVDRENKYLDRMEKESRS